MSDLTKPNSERVISVTTSGEASVLSGREYEALLGLSPAMSFATDVLMDAGMFDSKRYNLLRAVENQGEDPVAFARHLVKLSRALNG